MADSRWFGGPFHGGFLRFTVFGIHGGLGAWGARNSVPPWTDTHTRTHSRLGLIEPKRLRSFGKKTILLVVLRTQPLLGGFVLAQWPHFVYQYTRAGARVNHSLPRHASRASMRPTTVWSPVAKRLHASCPSPIAVMIKTQNSTCRIVRMRRELGLRPGSSSVTPFPPPQAPGTAEHGCSLSPIERRDAVREEEATPSSAEFPRHPAELKLKSLRKSPPPGGGGGGGDGGGFL